MADAQGNKTGGRKKGTPNKTTTLLKDAILAAAEKAGDKEGLIGYLEKQAKENPAPFMTLLGKVLPSDINTKLDVSDPLKELVMYVAANGGRLVKSDDD